MKNVKNLVIKFLFILVSVNILVNNRIYCEDMTTWQKIDDLITLEMSLIFSDKINVMLGPQGKIISEEIRKKGYSKILEGLIGKFQDGDIYSYLVIKLMCKNNHAYHPGICAKVRNTTFPIYSNFGDEFEKSFDEFIEHTKTKINKIVYNNNLPNSPKKIHNKNSKKKKVNIKNKKVLEIKMKKKL